MQKACPPFRKGFTLIELLVIIAIVAIIVSVVVVSLFGSREKAKIVRFKQAVHSLQTKAIEVCPTSDNTSMGDFTIYGPYGIIPSSIDKEHIGGGPVSCGPEGSGIFTLNVPSVDILPECTATIYHTGIKSFDTC